MTFRHKIVSAGLAAALLGGTAFVGLPASVAYADPADELEVARQTLESLGEELSGLQTQLNAATESLEQTQYSIGELEAQISATQTELEEKSALLGSTMKSSYKVGSSTLLDYVLGSKSIEDFIDRVYYLDKVSNHQAEAIEEVRSLQATLESQQSDLKAAEDDQQAQVDSLNTQVSDYQSKVLETQSYVDQLDAEVQAQLAAEAAEQERVRLALEAAEKARQQEEANNNSNNNSQDGSNGGDSGNNTPSEPDDSTPSDDGGSDSNNDGGNDNGGGDNSDNGGNNSNSGSADVNSAVATAYAQIGKAYSWGASGPNSFDCSGLVCYSFGYARGRSTYAMISSIQASGGWKTSIDQLSYGDLVFTSGGGHVGIYVGNGRMVHAANYSVGVIEGEIYNFIGGGSYY